MAGIDLKEEIQKHIASKGVIPTQLKTMRFNRVKFKSKIAFEPGWNNKPYSYSEISQYFPQENYGVMCGPELRVLDDDSPDKRLLSLFLDNFGDTFQVRDHLYFKFDNGNSKKIIFFEPTGEHLGELQGQGQYVVGPGSTHEKGHIYEVRKDCPIASINYEAFISIFSKYIKSNNSPEGVEDSVQEDDEVIKETEKKWLQGDRQNLALSLAGYLRKNKKYGFKHAEQIVRGICERQKDEEVDSRLRAVQETYMKDEEDVKGITALKERGIVSEQVFKREVINWTINDWFDSWEKIKALSKKTWGHKKEYTETMPSWYFLAHDKDFIEGKPQLIEPTQKKIPLIRLAINEVERLDENGEVIKDKYGKKQKMNLQSYYFFDEKYDGRTGYQKEALSLDFWLYRVISKEGKEYYVLSQTRLPNEVCSFKGMLVELDDFAEMSRSMKIKSLSRLFFLKKFEPSVKVLSKEELIEITKDISQEDWINYLDYHRFGNYNRFNLQATLLRSAFLLSGKLHGYPLHLAILGTAGTKKSAGYIETLAYKFSENPQICDGGNSRIKGLIPSFKERPANMGVLANSNRVGFIDELGKMIEREATSSHNPVSNLLGELNPMLDHAKRTANSGNDNLEVQANAKFLFTSNPISNRRTIKDHIGVIDATTMSRILWWVQDLEEQNFALSSQSIEEIPRTPKHIGQPLRVGNKEEGYTHIKKSSGDLIYNSIDNNTFLTIFDSCYSFLCDIPQEWVLKLFEIVCNLSEGEMKLNVWKPRGTHHITLLLDGLIKHRCLFIDHDPTFTPQQLDYDLCEQIVVRMANAWKTDLSIKREAKL